MLIRLGRMQEAVEYGSKHLYAPDEALAVAGALREQGDPDWDWHPRSFYRRRVGQARVTHGPVVPLKLAAVVNQFDDGLYRFAHLLSYQFARRFFQLHDLDFSDVAVQAVKGFPSDLGAPNFVMVVRAAVLGQELPEPFVPNDSLYGRFE